jgi:hypothetical protein
MVTYLLKIDDLSLGNKSHGMTFEKPLLALCILFNHIQQLSFPFAPWLSKSSSSFNISHITISLPSQASPIYTRITKLLFL